MSFEIFGLSAELNRALKALGFSTPTPIQEKAIPPALEGHDLIACAQTGTGKTAAFCIPMATGLMASPEATALVLAPTRELAQQIDAFWKQLTQFRPELGSICLIGGTSFGHQLKQLRRPYRLIIATPGRLVDHLNQGTVKLASTQGLVLDEADRMLDMGFAPQLNQIRKYLGNDRQTLLFTATWEKSLDQVAKQYLFEPVRVTVGPVSQAAATIEQSHVSTSHRQKNETLLDQLNQNSGSVLVFARTQHRTDRLARYLDSFGVEVGRIHGGRTQAQRNSALNNFRDGKIRVLVATDIAARGIDVPDIAHVINYDLPRVPEDYIHRIGRTGRAGSVGHAVSLVTPEDHGQWRAISRLLEKTGSKAPVPMKTPLVSGAVGGTISL